MNLSKFTISIIGTHPEDPKIQEKENTDISQTIVDAINRINTAAAGIYTIDGMPVSRARVYVTGKTNADRVTVSFPLGEHELSRSFTLKDFEALATDNLSL